MRTSGESNTSWVLRIPFFVGSGDHHDELRYSLSEKKNHSLKTHTSTVMQGVDARVVTSTRDGRTSHDTLESSEQILVHSRRISQFTNVRAAIILQKAFRRRSLSHEGFVFLSQHDIELKHRRK